VPGAELQKNNTPRVAQQSRAPAFGDASLSEKSANAAQILPTVVDSHWRSIATTDSTSLRPLSGMGSAVKRLFDFIAGSVAMLLLFPLMVLISIIVKLDSTGPALFCQPRSGRNREVIKVYKFRTMQQTGNAEFRQASKDDPRVTRVGAFLRRTSLDELPQLFNVIQGSMSLVGPRPHPLKLDEDFRHIIPALHSRYCVKPGITGWAQIQGYRGETRQLKDMLGRIEHDRYYIRNWSLWMDVRILALTVLKGWMHENAY